MHTRFPFFTASTGLTHTQQQQLLRLYLIRHEFLCLLRLFHHLAGRTGGGGFEVDLIVTRCYDTHCYGVGCPLVEV